ncbi:molybdopterin molybdotransferase MoeA [Thermovibrio sp.]
MKVKREEAKEIILSRVKKVEKELLTLDEAYGRVLGEEVKAKEEVPDENKSAIDGFAFKASSVKELPARLKIVGEVAAGGKEVEEVKEGEAVYITTGGIVPKGADTAVRIEDAKVEGGYLVIDFPVKRGSLINFKGCELKRGETVLEEGEVLDYRKVALLAHTGNYRVKVYQKVKVGVITTGNEVLEPYEPFKRGSVRNTNYYQLKGLIEEAGAEVVYFGRVEDEKEKLKEVIKSSLSSCHITITTGGVSKGKYDLIKEAVKELGVELLFMQTNVRPGRPLTFGVKGEKLFFGLPGYPAAALVNSVEFLLPALRKMGGLKKYENGYFEATAGRDIRSKEGRVDFVRVNFEFKGGKVFAFPVENQQTSNYTTIVKCNGLVIVEEKRGTVKEGEVVKGLFL